MPASATRDSSSLLECYQSAETHRLLCDILPQDDGSAQGTHALICKQLRGVGALTPADAVAEVRARNDDTGMLGNTIHIFLFTTDSGSDQVGCQKMFITEVRDCNTVWCLRCPCFQHQYSLDAKESYHRADVCMKDIYGSKHTYFASLAKLFNVWRAFFANIYKIWVGVDKSTAAQCSSKAPPRCLASRWGSAGDCEDMAGGGRGPSGEEVLELEDPSSEIATSEGDIFKCVQEISAGLVVVTPPWKPSEAESMLRWTESRVASAKALAMCATRESEFGGHAFPRPAGGWNLSLVLLPSEGKASLLHWQVFGASGQVVTLHDNDAIKFSTTYFFPVRCDFDFEWVVHDICIKMVKARKANCPQCPAFVLRLLSMFNCAFSTSDSVSALEGDAIDGDVPLETCLWCGESGDRRPVQCSLCMHFWHSTCVQMAATSSKMPEGAAHIAHVPELISKGRCQLC